MDQLTDALRELDPPLPPSSVDLDAVVRRAHRHRRRTRAFVTAVVAALALALAVTVPLDGGGAGDDSAAQLAACVPAVGGGASEPSADEVIAQARARLRTVEGSKLAMVFEGPLRQALPGATLLDAVTCTPGVWFRPEAGGFRARVHIVDAAGAAHLEAWVVRQPAPAGRACVRDVETATCVREDQPDGTVVYRSRVDYGGGAVLLTVDTYRPDGVHVRMSAGNFLATGGPVTTTRPVPPLDETALAALTQIERLTL
ncbi:hypothetical protein ACFO1B_37730 [Dactylosporangium siamense]|uniref:Uncharacterized protein n=1 Tax=Dactylosporangium siamense TaxID=685454 RepID=A0A919UGC2_9ACTN|nr:hypothetical protein [Dactylosporangium siamense]GIG49513.1 hypothetical protein Dsi01nite_075540 [Dactylosporangium siamense]